MANSAGIKQHLTMFSRLIVVSGVMLAVEAAASLDSRTVPHPEWAQISGQIEQTAVVNATRGGESLQATLRPSEGGRVIVDFGAVTTDSFRPKANDYIHVRGKAIEREGLVTILAQEVYAEGKVFSIHRNEAAAQDTAPASRADSLGVFPPSSAAPAPTR